ncbi:MAG: DEAD/DEAH box helicase, partial [Candidatus Bathyarchaeia archaeon]
MRAIFKNLCPNCSGDIEDDRAFAGLPCRQCLPVEHVTSSSLQTLIVKPSRSYLELTYINEQLNKFTSFFEKATSSQPWAAQRVWARRIFSGRSFALIAPTGMGKTVFGSIMALFLAGEKGWKSYILVPTALLAKQVSERILKYSERTGLNVKIAYYHSLLTGREASAQLEKIKSRDYDILVTTLNFLSIRFNLLEDVKFDFIFVDDVDSLLRASKNIDKVLMLLGFDQEDLKNASSLIDLRRELGRKLRRRSFSEASELYDEISKLMNSLEAKRRNVGVLVVSGASIRARRTRHVLLFGELLGFEISSRMDVGRNVADLYVESKNLEEDAYKLIGKLGSGGLIYIPMNLGAEYADKFKIFLAERGVKAEALTRVRKRVLEK